MDIRELRTLKGLTQEEAAKLVGLELRTYQNYEYGKSTRDQFKIKHIIQALNNYERITEDKGILKIDEIKKIVYEILCNTNISFVYLFGSYANSTASEKSDVDLLISDELKGLEFVGIVEELRIKLHKRVDLVRIDDLKNNFEFLKNIMCEGVKIYEKR